MKKYQNIAESFNFFYDSIYPDSGESQVLAARLVANHLIFLNTEETDHYLKIFFNLHADHYKVYNTVMDRRESVKRFFQMIADSFPMLSNHINKKVYGYVNDISDQKIDEIFDYVEKNRLEEKFYSFADVYNNPQNNITKNTLKTYIKKLGIEVKVKGDDNTKGKYITATDLQRILEAKNG